MTSTHTLIVEPDDGRTVVVHALNEESLNPRRPAGTMPPR